MIRITKADQTTQVETEIYAIGATDGFYNIKINEKVNDYGTMTFSCIPSVANFKLNDIITVYKDSNVYWQGIIVSITRNFYGDLNVVCYSMLWTLTFNIGQAKSYPSATSLGDIINDIQIANNLDYGSGASINTQYAFGVSFDGNAYADIMQGFELSQNTIIEQIKQLLDPYLYFYPTYYQPFNSPCFTLNIGEFGTAWKTINQPIEFGLNLLDFAEENSIANYITSVAPIGQNGLTVGSYTGQNGSGYIKASAAIITEYGERRARVDFDIGNVNDLYAAGTQWLTKNAFAELTLSLSAADLSHLTSLGYDEFKLGYFVSVKSTPFGLATTMPILERSIDIQDPAKSTITLSNTYQKTLTEYTRGNINA